MMSMRNLESSMVSGLTNSNMCTLLMYMWHHWASVSSFWPLSWCGWCSPRSIGSEDPEAGFCIENRAGNWSEKWADLIACLPFSEADCFKCWYQVCLELSCVQQPLQYFQHTHHHCFMVVWLVQAGRRIEQEEDYIVHWNSMYRTMVCEWVEICVVLLLSIYGNCLRSISINQSHIYPLVRRFV